MNSPDVNPPDVSPAARWTVRDAADADLPAVVDLVNALLATTTIEYTERPHTLDGRGRWLHERRTRGFPVLVAETLPTAASDRPQVIGLASYGDFRDSLAREGYAATVEHTVHVHRDWWGTGVGRSLMVELFARAVADGKHVMIGAVDAEHVDSLRFHERLGFVETARLPEVGRKFGRWLTLVLVQRTLDDAAPGVDPERGGGRRRA